MTTNVGDDCPKVLKDDVTGESPSGSLDGSPSESPEDELQFAATLKRLESTVKALESGELSLEESLKQFEEGIKLARNLESILDRAEKKVEEILNPEKASGAKDAKDAKDAKGEEGESGV